MDKTEKIFFIGLLLLALSLAGLLTYYHKQLMQPAPESISPFVDDHVVEIRIVMDEDDLQELKTNAMAKQYVRADFWFDGEPYPNVAVRPKGNSSLRHAAFLETGRVGLKVDFNFFNFAQTFRGFKKLNLSNGFSDPTLIRETIAYELFEQMDIPTPRTAFADVWVNDTHLGLYTMVEQVDKTFLRRHFSNPEGNLYKPEQSPAALGWTKEDFDRQNTQGLQASKSKQNNLDIKIGGARLGDLVKILKKEGAPGSEMLPDDIATSQGQGRFPGGPGGPGGQFPGGPRGRFPEDPNMPFPGGPGGQFPGGSGGPFAGDPNRPFPGGPGGGFPGPFPGDPNRPFPGGPGGQFSREPNESFAGGFRARGEFPAGRGGQFPDDPNSPFAAGFRGRRGFPGDPNRPFGGGFRARGGFPGGPGGMFGRGGNLIEQMGLKTNENCPDHSALFCFLEVLNKCPDETFPSEIEKVLNVDHVLKFLAVSALIVHLDNYIGSGHNYYLYESNGKFSLIPWDLNMAFGTFSMGFGRGTSIVDFYIDEPVTGAIADRPLVARLMAHKPYIEKYHQYLEQLLNGGFAEGVIEARIDELVEMIRPFVEADDLKFFSTEDFESNVSEGFSSQAAGEVTNEMDRGRIRGRDRDAGGRGDRRGGPGGGMNAPKLRAFIKARRLSVREQLDGKRPSRSQAGQNIGGTNMFDRFRGNGGQPE